MRRTSNRSRPSASTSARTPKRVGRLRAARTRVARAIARGLDPTELSERDDQAATVVIGQWRYIGTGWLTIGDAALADMAADAARQRRPAGTNTSPSTPVASARHTPMHDPATAPARALAHLGSHTQRPLIGLAATSATALLMWLALGNPDAGQHGLGGTVGDQAQMTAGGVLAGVTGEPATSGDRSGRRPVCLCRIVHNRPWTHLMSRSVVARA
jgi:hypothetical protein